MKPILAVLSDGVQSEDLFVAKEVRLPFFSNEFHFHEECQLVHIVKSSGKRIIGDLVDYFESGELIFLGSNIPHVWHNTQEQTNGDEPEPYAHSLSIYFNPSKLLLHLSAFGNVRKIESFLNKAQRGVELKGRSRDMVVKLMYQILQQEGLQKIITLLDILNIMSSSDTEYDLLASINYINYYQYNDSKRMDQVFKYIFDNFREDISLNTIADVANMNTFAFCRFFKARTQKSFTQFVNETRIGYACKLLGHKETSITDIAYECGFNNVSNFNRFFKVIKKVSPREYRNQILS
ncbi:AraC family transcriptional regulator [Mucilaginibacter rubeus]|uniref:Helix-turn-helix transcriptional regulator n=1 Tax=Mucilaginibacter rubeus TaxID=2027860 RepID=A0A5C1HZU6_9SPHI|nr:AraC family transcriptional regulator [Mucilaginibacter rubeus]QEM11225.1 helix-turn-helix transcriptional regulator [Mucilaginibacter rubeus]